MRISDWSSDVCSSDLTAYYLSTNPAPLANDYCSISIERCSTNIQATRRSSDCAPPGEPSGSPLHRWGSSTMSLRPKIGRASCGETVCQNVKTSVYEVYL